MTKQWKKISKFYLSLCIAFSLFVKNVDKIFAQNDVFGKIKPPPGVDEYNTQADIGIIVFASRLINFGAIVAGIWTLINIITAGWIYLTANDSSAHEKVGNKILNSVIGLAIIVFSYTIAGLISFLVFGDATFILQPELPSAPELQVGPGPAGP